MYHAISGFLSLRDKRALLDFNKIVPITYTAQWVAEEAQIRKTTLSHIQNKSFALKVKFQRNASKFPIFM